MGKKKIIALSVTALVVLGGVAFVGLGDSGLFQGSLRLKSFTKTSSKSVSKVVNKNDSTVKIIDNSKSTESKYNVPEYDKKITPNATKLSITNDEKEYSLSDNSSDTNVEVISNTSDDGSVFNAYISNLSTQESLQLKAFKKNVGTLAISSQQDYVNKTAVVTEAVAEARSLAFGGPAQFIGDFVYRNIGPNFDRTNPLGNVKVVDYSFLYNVGEGDVSLLELERTTREDEDENPYDIWITSSDKAVFPLIQNGNLQIVLQSDRTCRGFFAESGNREDTWSENGRGGAYIDGYVYVENEQGVPVYVHPILQACDRSGANQFFRTSNELTQFEEASGYFLFSWNPNLCTSYNDNLALGESNSDYRNVCPSGEYTIKVDINGTTRNLGVFELE